MPPPVRPDAETRLSVVVVAYNSAAALTATLPPLVAQLGPRDELVVVDNDSRDATLAVVRELAPAAVVHRDRAQRRLRGRRERGRGRGERRAAALPQPRRDVRRPASSRRSPRRCGDGRGWAAWMGLVTAEDGRVVNTNGGVVHFTGIAWAGEAGAAAPGSLTGAREAAFLSGACLAIPRAEWERAGGFAEGLLHVPRGRRPLAPAAPRGRAARRRAVRRRRPRLRRSPRGRRSGGCSSATAGRRSCAAIPAGCCSRSRPRCSPPSSRCSSSRRPADGCRRSSAARPRRCAGCRGCCASAARSRRRARSPRREFARLAHPRPRLRVPRARRRGWRRCAGRSARTGGSPSLTAVAGRPLR